MTDTPTLIEAIAMAICAANGCEDDLLPEPEQTDATWHNYVDLARAALSALTLHASENFDYAEVGDGWLLVKKPFDQTPIDEAEHAAAKSDMIAGVVAFLEREGYAVVPVEPTNEMLAEGRRFAVPATQSISPIYAAMLSARPKVTP